MSRRYRRTTSVTTRATLWRSFRIFGFIAMGVGAAALVGVLLWNRQHPF